MKLTNTACKNATCTTITRKLSDGHGLYLEVTARGGKYWRLKYYFNGDEKRISFGTYPNVSLQEAREKARLAKKQLAEGHNPVEVKRLEKIERLTHYENSFESIAREWHEQRYHTWKVKHAATILKRLEANIFPLLGGRPIKAITAPELLAAVRKVEKRGAHDVAHRIMQVCSQVFRYAIATGRAERDICQDLRGALAPVISENYAHLREKDLPGFLKKLSRYEQDYNGTTLTRLAFEFLVLTFVRSGEIRGAHWSEIDWDKAQWRIPAERMKMKEQHIVPLSTQSIAVLKQLHELTADSYSGYIFPSQQNPRKMMSENTFLKALDIMGYKGKATAHGFRATASTILNEHNHRPDVIERQLAHAERDQVRSAYNHAEYLPERREMMQWWGDYVEQAVKGAAHA
jgi:integrase